MTLCRIRSPKEFAGLSQAIVCDNVFEGGPTHRGIGIQGDQVNISNNIFSGYSKETPIKITGASHVVCSGNVIDLTCDSGCPDNYRDGLEIVGDNIIVSDNQIVNRGGDSSRVTGIAVSEASKNIIIHDNIINNCAFGIRAGVRCYRRRIPEDMSSGDWQSEYLPLIGKVNDCHGDILGVVLPEYSLSQAMLTGEWLISSGDVKICADELVFSDGILQIRTKNATEFNPGQRIRLQPVLLNWNIHSNMLVDCRRAIAVDNIAEYGIRVRDNLIRDHKKQSIQKPAMPKSETRKPMYHINNKTKRRMQNVKSKEMQTVNG